METLYIFLDHGLANRLRTIAGFLQVYLETGKKFIFHWDTKQKDCNGKFNDIFEPVIIGKNKIIIEDKEFDNKINYHFAGQDTLLNILAREIPKGPPRNLIAIENNIYKYFIPKQKILQIARSFPKIGASMHIRRTDHVALAKKNNKFTEDNEFIKFIEENEDVDIFLATDDFETQQKFQKYKNVVVFKQILRAGDFRQTSLEEALIDVLIAAAADKFMGSKYSSFSKLIEIYKRII
jgi:hypothetical protein